MTTHRIAKSLPVAVWLRRFVNLRRNEAGAAAASFIMFFALLSAYYVIRPVRDEIGIELGKDALHQLFTFVFLAMVAAVPLFGLVAARFPRRVVLPAVYLFFTLNLVLFWIVLRAGHNNPLAAGAFFVWGSVFNLFVVSLFWSLMSELWSHEEAKRLYGLISAGGTAGALAGPALTQTLVGYFAPIDLLIVSAGLLFASMVASLIVRRLRPVEGGNGREPAGGGILEGAAKVFTMPLFGRIALFVLLANIVGTFFYLEQARVVSQAIADSAQRVAFFSRRDLIVGVATLLIEVFGTAQVLRHFGLTAALLALPLAALSGVVALELAPSLSTIAAVMVAERVVSFALANPAIKVIYTLTTPEEKYKVQNFIDTVVFRGGDAASGWVYAIAGAGSGFAGGMLSVIAVPLVAAWLFVARNLGGDHRRRVDELGGDAAEKEPGA